MKKATILKKTLAVLFAALLIVPLLTVGSSARNLYKRNDSTDVPLVDPTVDGVIAKEDGWSDPIHMTSTYCHNFIPSSQSSFDGKSIEVYFAYSDSGIYFAADIDESKAETGEGALALSTDRDYEENNEGEKVFSKYGFNGDVFIFTFDPFDSYIRSGYRTYDDCAPWYCVGFFEDGAQMYHSYCDDGILTADNGIKLVGVNHGDDTYTFEAMIPWDVVIEDMKVNSFGQIEFTKDELMTKCAKYSALCGYRDMFYDIEQRGNSLYGIFSTCGDYAKDGMDVTAVSDGLSVRFFALNLYMSGRTDFTDTKMGDWFYKGAAYCYEKGLLTGMTKTEFGPGFKMTRAMIVTALGNNSRMIPKYYYGTSFSDVVGDEWFAPYVEWARKNGIVSGYEDGTFRPNGTITREELALILKNYAQHILLKTQNPSEDVLDKYADKDKVQNWSLSAVRWAVQNGIISGIELDGDMFVDPQGNATRAQVATMLFKLLNVGYNEYWY